MTSPKNQTFVRLSDEAVLAQFKACYELVDAKDAVLTVVADGNKGVLEIHKPDGQKVNSINYRWFTGIDYPLFRHFSHSENWIKQNQTPEKRFIPTYCMMNDTAQFQIDGPQATPELHAFLEMMMLNYITDQRYLLTRMAGAFFQGGHGQPFGKWFKIEFWRSPGVDAWMDYLNQHFDQEGKFVKAVAERYLEGKF